MIFNYKKNNQEPSVRRITKKGKGMLRFWKGKKKGTLIGAFRCKSCKTTLAVWKLDDPKAIELASEETRGNLKKKVEEVSKYNRGVSLATQEIFGTVCPKCEKYLDETTVLMIMILDEKLGKKIVKSARRAGIFYE